MEWFLQHVWLVSFAVVAILVAAYGYFCAWRIYNIGKQIDAALAAEDIAAALKSSPLLAPAWRSFEQTLTRTSEAVYSTIDAAEFFSERTLTRGMNMSFWQAYGGIFTGLGILGTFAGLTFGLSGVDMTSGDIDVLKDGIKNLLSGVESAFVTSLVGIFFGLVYNVAHHKLIVALHDKIVQLTDALDEKFPRRSAEDWLSKNSATLEKICAAIDKLNTGGTGAIGEIFSDRVGAQMDRFSDALDRFSDTVAQKLSDAQKIFDATIATMKAAADANIEQGNRTVENINAAAENNAAEISRAVAAFREIVDAHNAATKKTFADIQKLLNESETYLQRVADAGNSLSKAAAPVKESTWQLWNNLVETSNQMKTLSSANQTTRENLAALSEQLTTFTKNFNGIANELERSTNIIRDSLDNYNGKISDGLTNALTQFDKTVSNALGGLNELIEDLSDALDDFNRKRR